ncbi:hypothetical protein SAMN04488028_1011210 [Reichenbachiella agariperforans]|uniref:Uncharacterized protein n=1 Tax=Reichenbachiella agariperforans TaxID=156994 RepID=A0A1M6M3N5_REIAG|nr:hypothetical protein SAMN04488028_1011210 [Reichenbachiella agariperforans]
MFFTFATQNKHLSPNTTVNFKNKLSNMVLGSEMIKSKNCFN